MESLREDGLSRAIIHMLIVSTNFSACTYIVTDLSHESGKRGKCRKRLGVLWNFDFYLHSLGRFMNRIFVIERKDSLSDMIVHEKKAKVVE